MASILMYSAQVGGVFIQSGRGVPTHISPIGSEYTDMDTAIVYQNIDGIATWVEFLTNASTGATINGNISATTVTTNGLTANTISATSVSAITYNGYIPANDSNVVHITGVETILGAKTFSPNVLAAANIARGTTMTPTLVAIANSDTLIGLDINPTFNAGSYTNVTQYALRVAGNAYFTNNLFVTTGTTSYYNNHIGIINPANNITFRVGATDYLQMFGNTGNFVMQNGGSYVDAGFKLDVFGKVRISDDALINGVTVGIGNNSINTNTVVGNKGLFSNVIGSGNVAVGYYSLTKNRDGSGNVAIGANSMFNNDDGNSNIAIGPFSLFNGISNRGSIAIGSSSLLNAEGRNNLAIGFNSAISLTNGDNNNVIGNENDFTPNGNSLSSDRNLLSISKNNDSNVGYPQIWSPEQVLVNLMTTGKVLPISSYIYAAVFIDYVILDTNLSSRAGTLKCVFDANRTNIKWNETTTGDIGSTSDYVFDFIDNGSEVMLELTNNNTSYDVYINYTARLILRPII